MFHNTYTSGIIVVLWHRETHTTHKGIDRLSRIERRSISVPLHWRNTASCQLSNMFVSRYRNCVKRQPQWNGRGGTGQLTTHLECTGINFNAHVCWCLTAPWLGRHTYLWFKFDAPTEGNAYIHTYIHIQTCMHICFSICLCYIGKWFRIEWSCLSLVNPGFEAGHLRHPLPSRLNDHSLSNWAIKDQVKKWTRWYVRVMCKRLNHLAPRPESVHIKKYPLNLLIPGTNTIH